MKTVFFGRRENALLNVMALLEIGGKSEGELVGTRLLARPPLRRVTFLAELSALLRRVG